jgi:hypothetical protein
VRFSYTVRGAVNVVAALLPEPRGPERSSASCESGYQHKNNRSITHRHIIPLLYNLTYAHHTSEYVNATDITSGKAVTQLVETLRYKLEGRGFDS